MTKALIDISTVVRQDGDEDRTAITTEGSYMKNGDGEWVFSYDDTDATGFAGSKTTFTVRGDSLCMVREGESGALLQIERGKKTSSQYNINGGNLRFDIYTKELVVRLGENGGTVDVDYSMDVTSDVRPGIFSLGDYSMRISVVKPS